MNKEAIYDKQINPLMTKIIAICKQHRIAFLADFALGDDLKCTSAILEDDCDPTDNQLQALDLLKPQSPFAMAITTETKPDGSQHVTMRRIS